MSLEFTKNLFWQTLRAPRAAAERILALNLPRDWLWMALVLMGVLNGIVYSMFLQMGPAPDPDRAQMIPPVLQSPMVFTLFLVGALAITVVTLTWVGRAMGGKAQLSQILALIGWLQVLRLIVQIVLLVLMLALPLAGMFFVIMASVWGLVILVVFVDRAHEFGNSFKAAGVIILGFLGMLIGLSIFLSVVGALFMGGA
ncbi:Yip1 family protein [Roseovarius arcticus]|uniref:Yip1 family protein n=1 Tax=Roseovarius arcticus TaxID=2547404 RepID=UPI001FE357AB|nr:Yip1 family protein [Roseovarius arcticus]